MIFFESLLTAFEALRANLLRSILTTLGIIIGTAAVIAVVSVVQGLQFMISNQLQSVGSTYIIVTPQRNQQGPGIVSRPVKLTWDDGLAIQQQVPGVALITPLIGGQLPMRFKDRQHTPAFVFGVNEDYPDVSNHTVGQGRFLGRLDVERRRKVAVVGEKVVEELALGDDPIGMEVYVGSLPVTVIGVMEHRGQTLGTNVDDLVFVPFDSALSLFGRSAGEQVQLRMQAASAEVTGQVEDGIRDLLRRRHEIPEDQPDDFQILLQDQILEAVGKVLGGITAVIGAIVSVALVVGGIGIMNIMLVSVTERTREIGLRKSVGARREDILLQFLIEAVILSLIGGILGILLGYGAGALAVQLIPGDLPPAHVPLWAIGLAFGFCSLVGIGFGIYPASKAAALDPIEALRYE